MASCDLATLQTDACTNQFLQAAQDEVMFRALLLQLACNISTGGGGSTCGNYSGGQPNFTPASGCAMAIDTSNGAVWYYYGGAWH